MAKGRIEINTELCKGCLYCVAFCPKHILAQGEELNSKGYLYAVNTAPEECVGCATCGQMCPECAITVYR